MAGQVDIGAALVSAHAHGDVAALGLWESEASAGSVENVAVYSVGEAAGE